LSVGITGDSAGGNLTVSVTIMALTHGIRVPDFIVPVYPALLAQPVPSPSRVLSIMDPMLSTAVSIIIAYPLFPF
tara:strand:- start:521 stop:745 length:225 start_codon:yes stop_codon:yes gene_type:complete